MSRAALSKLGAASDLSTRSAIEIIGDSMQVAMPEKWTSLAVLIHEAVELHKVQFDDFAQGIFDSIDQVNKLLNMRPMYWLEWLKS
eukprot:4480491-Pyramimonas_sp.AAC.1